MKLSQQARLLPFCGARAVAKVVYPRNDPERRYFHVALAISTRKQCYFSFIYFTIWSRIRNYVNTCSKRARYDYRPSLQRNIIRRQTRRFPTIVPRSCNPDANVFFFFFLFFFRKQFHIVQLTKQNEIKSGTSDVRPLLLSFELRAINYHYRRTVETEII